MNHLTSTSNSDDADAKFWLEDPPRRADSHGFSAHELLAISRIVARERTKMEAKWHEHFR